MGDGEHHRPVQRHGDPLRLHPAADHRHPGIRRQHKRCFNVCTTGRGRGRGIWHVSNSRAPRILIHLALRSTAFSIAGRDKNRREAAALRADRRRRKAVLGTGTVSELGSFGTLRRDDTSGNIGTHPQDILVLVLVLHSVTDSPPPGCDRRRWPSMWRRCCRC